jgi:hypothetical protein
MVVVEPFGYPVGERGVGQDTIVIVAPGRQQLARFAEPREKRLVEKLVAQPPVKTLDERVLLRVTGLDVVPVDAGGLGLLDDRHAGEFSAVVRDTGSGPRSRRRYHGIQLARDAGSR